MAGKVEMGQHMRIALADDEQDVVHYLKSIIEELGHTTVIFSDGNALSQSLVRETYDLVILL
jgi:DNA-binding response OmpR family regulator